jgi:hypothetical protein
MLRDIMLDSQRLPVIAGSTGIVGSFGMIGRQLGVLRDDCFNLVKQFKIPSAQYRNDCCERVFGVVRELDRLLYDKPYMEPVRVEAPKVEYPSPDTFKEMIVSSKSQAPVHHANNNVNLAVPPSDVNSAPKFE